MSAIAAAVRRVIRPTAAPATRVPVATPPEVALRRDLEDAQALLAAIATVATDAQPLNTFGRYRALGFIADVAGRGARGDIPGLPGAGPTQEVRR